MEILLEAIARYQKDKGIKTDATLAKDLKLDESTISRLKSQERKPGAKVIARLFQKPELQLDVINYLRRQDN